MKIRKCANLLLGAAVPVLASAPPGFELPPPSPRFELPPPAQAGFASKTSSSAPEPCAQIFSPWDLMSQLDLSDPQEEEVFMETYSVPVIRRASWLLPASMSAGCIMEDEEEMVNVVNDEEEEEMVNMAVDMVNESILEPCVPTDADDAGKKTATKKNESKPKTKKGKEKAEESNDSSSVEEVWTCKKNDGKRWFCRWAVSRPDSFCAYHSDPKLPDSLKPCRKRTPAFGNAVGDVSGKRAVHVHALGSAPRLTHIKIPFMQRVPYLYYLILYSMNLISSVRFQIAIVIGLYIQITIRLNVCISFDNIF